MEGSRDQIGCYRDLKQASRGEEQLKALKVVWVVCSTRYAVCGMQASERKNCQGGRC